MASTIQFGSDTILVDINGAATASGQASGQGEVIWCMTGDGFDDGLQHHHHWARDSRASARSDQHPMVPDAAAIPTPSTAVHDDCHHAA